MKLLRTLVLASLAATLVSGPVMLMATPATQSTGESATQFGRHHADKWRSAVRSAAKDHGLSLLSFSMQEQLSFGNGVPSSGQAGVSPLMKKAPSSCTASASVGIPGGTKVEITATAPTCAAAVAMVIAGIKAIKGNM